jgi:hypothetical protein
MPKPAKPKCIGRVPVKDANRQRVHDEHGNLVTRPCTKWPVAGATVCDSHGGNAPQVRRHALVRAELDSWGLGDSKIDPGEMLLRLVSQAGARVERYSLLLAEAFDAAERLRKSTEHVRVDGDEESAAVQQAREDLDRIFTTGGVGALIGNTYSASNAGSLYATGEQIRGLAMLEAQERDRCANFAAKAVAAGLAERAVRLAERQVELMVAAVEAALDAAGVPTDRRAEAKLAAASHLRLVN